VYIDLYGIISLIPISGDIGDTPFPIFCNVRVALHRFQNYLKGGKKCFSQSAKFSFLTFRNYFRSLSRNFYKTTLKDFTQKFNFSNTFFLILSELINTEEESSAILNYGKMFEKLI